MQKVSFKRNEKSYIMTKNVFYTSDFFFVYFNKPI